MSSALSDEVAGPEMVVFLQWDRDGDSLVLHRAHADCPTDTPHRLSACGRFVSATDRFGRSSAVLKEKR